MFKFTFNDYLEILEKEGKQDKIYDLLNHSGLVLEGIPPRYARQVSGERSSIEKSIELESGKYANYSVKQYVDVKRRDLFAWNLVGNGDSYPTTYNADGSVNRAGCGFMYKDEGLGCLNSEGHDSNMGYVKLITHKCMRPQCPTDYEYWAAREASRIEDKFRRVPKLIGQPETAEGRTQIGVPIHLVISVPEKDAYLMDLNTLEVKRSRGRHACNEIDQTEFTLINHYKKLTKKAQNIAKKVGFKGGCMIFHPFANDKLDENDEMAESFTVDPLSGEFDVKKLKAYFRKINGEISSGDPKNELRLWYIRPHFHLIGYGWIENTQQVYNKTGYVVKNLKARDSVFMTALYQLSHAGYREGQHTVTWIGCMSNRKYCELDPTPELPKTMPVCPECHKELKPVRWVGEGISELDSETSEGTYFVTTSLWEYIPDEVVPAIYDQYDQLVQHERVLRSPGYRGRIVKPTQEEKDRRAKRKRGLAK